MNLHIKMVYASKPITIRFDAIKIENGMFLMYRDGKRLFTYDLHSIDYFYYERSYHNANKIKRNIQHTDNE